jgi:hypothetical protein
VQSNILANLETALATFWLEKAWNFGEEAGGHAALQSAVWKVKVAHLRAFRVIDLKSGPNQ